MDDAGLANSGPAKRVLAWAGIRPSTGLAGFEARHIL
jgi:hypothetical protein